MTLVKRVCSKCGYTLSCSPTAFVICACGKYMPMPKQAKLVKSPRTNGKIYQPI